MVEANNPTVGHHWDLVKVHVALTSVTSLGTRQWPLKGLSTNQFARFPVFNGSLDFGFFLTHVAARQGPLSSTDAVELMAPHFRSAAFPRETFLIDRLLRSFDLRGVANAL